MNTTAIKLAKNSDHSELIPSHVCYEARWHDRSVFISAPCQSALEWQWHCLASAILLERLEEACVFAETILDSSLQFYVSELPKNESKEKGSVGKSIDTDYLKMVLTQEHEEIEIWLPRLAHSRLHNYPELIFNDNISWSTVSAKVKIAEFSLDDQDVGRIALGSVLLIPSSWKQRWRCSIVVAQLESQVYASITREDGLLTLNEATSQKILNNNLSRRNKRVDVYLSKKIQIDPTALFSIKSDSALANEEQTTNCIDLDLAQCDCYVNGSNQYRADLLPVAQGYGLRITEAC